MSLRCLIVDDNPRFGDEARSLLEHEGVSVVGVAASGDEAVLLAEQLGPDLALVDISLGDESGFDVALRLVNHSTTRPRFSALVPAPPGKVTWTLPDSNRLTITSSSLRRFGNAVRHSESASHASSVISIALSAVFEKVSGVGTSIGTTLQR